VATTYHIHDEPDTPRRPEFDEVLDVLGRSYDGSLRIGEVRTASSEWWRNEIQFIGKEPLPSRWVRRLHLFESGPHSAGRYVGYVHVRPKWAGQGPTQDEALIPPVADGFLVPPLRMAGGHYKIIGLGETCQIYGDPLFAALPYVMADGRFKLYCSEACLYIAMLMMMPYGARPLGPWDMTIKLRVAEAQKNHTPSDELICIKFEGLVPENELAILERPECKLSGIVVPWKSTLHEDLPLLIDVLRCYLEGGLPILVHVEVGKLYPSEREVQAANPTHAILLVGFREDGGTLSFVYHDPAYGPYLEIEAMILAASVKWFSLKANGESELTTKAAAIAIAPKAVRFPLHRALVNTKLSVSDVAWRAQLIHKSHLVKHLGRTVTQPLTAPVHEYTDIVERRIRETLPEVHDFVWLLSREIHGNGIWARAFDATSEKLRILLTISSRDDRIRIQRDWDGPWFEVWRSGSGLQVSDVRTIEGPSRQKGLPEN